VKTGAKIITENACIVDIRLTGKIFNSYLQFRPSLSIALKIVLSKNDVIDKKKVKTSDFL